MKKIELTKGYITLVDNKDFNWINQWKWHYNHGYAMRKEWLYNRKKYRTVYMHRLINDTESELETDHINRDKLDNRRKNLRSVSKSVNQSNKGIQKNNTSGFTGIFFEKQRNKWRIRLSMNKKRVNFGSFKDLESAVSCYKEIKKQI